MPRDCFEIGGENLLKKVVHPSSGRVPEDESDSITYSEVLDDIRARLGVLLKCENVSILLGAGASFRCGGVGIGNVPLSIEKELGTRGIGGAGRRRIKKWLRVFYLAVLCCGDDNAPKTRQDILERHPMSEASDSDGNPLEANLENLLATLWCWHSAIPEGGDRLRVDGPTNVDVKRDDICSCICEVTRALAMACDLPTKAARDGLLYHRTLIRKMLARPLNLKRVAFFTLNYDTLFEQAADAEGAVLLDGFVGTQCRVLRPESYDQDLYYPAETTEGHVHRFDRVLPFYKLHGSTTWVYVGPSDDNPYGVKSVTIEPGKGHLLTEKDRRLIYPMPMKHEKVLALPYSELFRRFANALVRPQSVLFVFGFGFGDPHVNSIIQQALSIPSFTIVIVDPNPENEFVKSLRRKKNPRVWVIEGETFGKFEGFVSLLPDLHGQEIRKKGIETLAALKPPKKD